MPGPGRPTRTILTFAITIAAVSGAPVTATTVDGTVRDSAGAGVPGIEVSLLRFGATGWTVEGWNSTAANGAWSIEDVRAGTYRLKLFDWSQRYAYEYHDDVTSFDLATDIEVAAEPVTIDAVVEPGGRIAGSLSTPAGEPLENSSVVSFDADGQLLYFEQLQDTTYEVGGLPSGGYLLRFNGAQQGTDGQWSYFQEWYDDASSQGLATPVPVTAGQTTADVDATMGFDPGGTVAGVIVDLYGRPYRSARVEAWRHVGGDWIMVRADDTGASYYDGEYSLDLPPGTYRLRFEGSTDYNLVNSLVEWWPDATAVDEAEDVVVAVGQSIEIDGTLGELASGGISGTVTDDTGEPLAGVEVSIRGAGGELYRHFTRTGPDGDYVIEGLQPDRYLLEFFDPSYGVRWAFLGGTQDWNQADRVQVFYDAVTGVDQSMLLGTDLGSITGNLSDAAGTPASGIRVWAVDATGAVGWGTSRGDGSYRLRSLADGTYRVELEDPEGRFIGEWYDDVPSEPEADPVDVSTGAATAGIDAVLATAGGISGTVVDAFGGPFPLTTIGAYEFDGSQWAQAGGTFLFQESDYVLAGLPPGIYRVVFSGGSWGGGRETEWYDDAPNVTVATDVEVVAGELTPGIDAVVGSGPAGAIAGTVTDGSGAPAEGIEVNLYDESLTLRHDAAAVTGADGGYAVEPLFSGLYYVEFEDPQGQLPSELYDDAASLAMATPVQVSGGPVTGIDAVLDGAGGGPGGGAIAGLVTDETTGDPIEGIRVDCFSADLLDQPPCVTPTAADGSYFLGGNLPEAAYRVRFSAPAGSYASEYFDDVTSAGDATAVAVSLGAVTTGIDASLTAAGAIAGTVTDAAGEPLPKLLVTAHREVGGEWRQVASAMTFYEAEWRIASLEPGIYRVRFADGYEGFFGESEFFADAVSVATADDVPVSAGQTAAGIDAVLREDLPGGIAGTLVDAGGAPADGIEVTVYAASGAPVTTALTGDDGTYIVPNLVPGTYAAGFEDPAGELPGEFYLDVATLALATPIDVGYAVVDGIDALLDGPGTGQGGAALEGLVTDAVSGQPVEDVEVLCFTPNGFLVPRCRTTSAADGSYRLGGFLPARPVLVRFQAADGHLAEWYDGAPSFVDATSIPLSLGTTITGVDVVLTPGAPLLNPGFDEDLSGWDVDAPLGAVAGHSAIDAHGDVSSGSAWVSADGAPGAVVALEQCVPVTQSADLEVGGRVRIESTGSPVAVISVEPFADSACGTPAGTESGAQPVLEGTTSALWRDVSSVLEVPVDVGSLRLRFELHAAGAESFDAFWDALYLAETAPALFRDGFESGDTNAWSEVRSE